MTFKSLILANILLLSAGICSASPMDLFIRALLVKRGVNLEKPKFAKGDVYIEAGGGEDWRTTYATKVIAVDENEIRFVQSSLYSGSVETDRYTYSVNLLTGEVSRIEGDKKILGRKISDWDIRIIKQEKRQIQTNFGLKNCTQIRFDLVAIRSTFVDFDRAYTFCDSLNGSGAISNSGTVISPSRDLKEYYENQ